LSTAEEQRRDAADGEPGAGYTQAIELVTALWLRRRWLAAVTGVGILLSLVVAFVIPKEYRSTAELMPPDQKALTTLSVMDPLSSLSSVAGGGLINSRTPGQTIIGVLRSHSIQERIIDRLDLMRVYHCKLMVEAQAALSARTLLEEDRPSGIITIAVNDKNPGRARDIATAYIQELNKLLIAENASSAHLERVFLENRLQSLKGDLDDTTAKLSKFSSNNATLNPQTQGASLIDAAAKLQSELIAAESELDGLKAQYSDDNVRVKTARARVEEMQSQLRKMGGGSEMVKSVGSDPNQPYPSIRELPLLGATYSDIYRQMMMQEDIYAALTKQYELAKVQEAKEIPTIKVLDPPELPEKKSYPHRSVILAVGTLLSAFAGIAWVLVGTLWERTSDDNPTKAFVRAILNLSRSENPVKAN
jgi:uncharacterized protein involved in exopolysaccharide biosynthesis